MMKHILSFLLLLALMITLLVPAQAEGPALSSGGLTLGNNVMVFSVLHEPVPSHIHQE